MSFSSFAPNTAEGPLSRAWRLLSAEPHRIMFFCGILQLVGAVAWWFADLTGRYVAWHEPLAWTLPPSWAHAWLLLYGVFPFFIFGFLMTAGPSWLGAPKMPRTAFVPAAVLMGVGVLAFYAGLATHRALVAAGTLLHLAGWIWGIQALVRVAVRHWNQNARYALVIFTFVGIGVAGAALFALSVAFASYAYIRPTLHGAVWFFLLPIFVGVSTRMVPFFSSRVLGPAVDYRPAWLSPALMAGVIAHGALELGGAQAWLWLVDFPLAALVAYLAFRWGLFRRGSVRLLAVLHISIAILACALALYGILSAAFAAGVLATVGLAPLHLLVIGYFAAMVVGMVSRVSLGHSGRPLEADTLTWACYLGVLACAVTRAAAELAAATPAGAPLMIAAALVWLASFGAWAWRYVPMYVTPRADARR
ncbi:MAG: NnrS family protein [Burkholderiales bacterium]